MLGQHIRPENLPEGNTVSTPAPIPGRRTSAPKVAGKSGSALSDPSRKPSRVRAAEEAQVEGEARAERAPKKTGWAKATPKFEHPKKNFKPRARPEGEGAAAAEDRPRRAFKPREDKIIGPKSATWARDADKGRGGKPRAGGPASRSGPAKPRGPVRPRGPRSDG
jgi:23S rRNA pseudouridine2605 synthase